MCCLCRSFGLFVELYVISSNYIVCLWYFALVQYNPCDMYVSLDTRSAVMLAFPENHNPHARIRLNASHDSVKINVSLCVSI
jgi:hypothetical protein